VRPQARFGGGQRRAQITPPQTEGGIVVKRHRAMRAGIASV
jgi:hypothetical protein